jgi:hypothetical protein
MKKSRHLWSEKEARLITRMAVEEGLLSVSDSCVSCGSASDRMALHHPDLMLAPLCVVSLCPSCHGKAHAGWELPNVPGVYRPLWTRDQERKEHIVRRACLKGGLPKRMPFSVFAAEADRLGLLDTFRTTHRRCAGPRTCRMIANKLAAYDASQRADKPVAGGTA